MISTKSYVFPHRRAIFRESTNTKDQKFHIPLQVKSRFEVKSRFSGKKSRFFYQKWNVELVNLGVRRLPEDGTPVPKHVGVGTYY